MQSGQLRKKILSVYTISLFILSSLLGTIVFDNFLIIDQVKGANIVVDIGGNGDYQTIQEAIDNASGGDTIYVWAGVYNENITINKSITLIGNSTTNTTINGVGTGTVINITSSWVNISGLEIKNSGSASLDAAIKLYYVEHCTISYNNCTSNKNGIVLHSSTNNIITNNFCRSNSLYGIYGLYNSINNIIKNNTCLYNNKGIFLYTSDYCDIINNTCSDNGDGISLTTSKFSNIIQNTCISNSLIGIWLYSGSRNNTIANNTCNEHSMYEGIRLQNSGRNLIINNSCKDNWDGLYLDQSARNTISNNKFNSNGDGIYLRQGNINIITNNDCNLNSYGGIYLMYCYQNWIENNSCVYNSVEGIRIADSDQNIIRNNNLSYQKGLGFSGRGVRISGFSDENIIENNSISYNGDQGMLIERGKNNIIANNTISYNGYKGIQLYSAASGTTIYHNNIIDNSYGQADDAGGNIWNLSYPIGGNYWDDYNGYDNFSGPFQNITGSDGFGDTQLNISGGSGAADKYPMMHPYFWWADDSPIILLIGLTNNSLIRAGTKIKFLIWDQDFNLNNTFYSINGGMNQTFTTTYELDTTTWSDNVSYLIKVYADDKDGNINIKYYNFTIDALDPVIDLISPKDGSAFIPGIVLDFNVTDTNLKLVISYLDGGGGKDFYAPYDIDTSAWSEGNHTVAIRAEDEVGHIVWRSFKFSIDTKSPIISLISPANNSLIKAGTDIELDIVEPNVANANFSVNSSQNQSFSYQYRIFTWGWTDGQYIIRVHVNDTVMHKASKWFNFTLDATAPEIRLLSPVNNSVFHPGTIVGFEVSDLHLDFVQYLVNNGSYKAFSTKYEINTSGWSDGNYIIKVKAIDQVKNLIVKDFKFSIDSLKPTLSLISPHNNSVIRSGVSIDFKISDAHLDDVKYKINGGADVPLLYPYSISTTTWLDGQYDIEILANDSLDHRIVKSYTFIIDTITPSIELLSPSNLSLITPGIIINLNINDLNLNYVNYSLNGDIYRPISAPYDLDTFTWPDGNNTIIIIAIDKAGNFATKQYTFSIDSTKPFIDLISPSNNSIIQPGTAIELNILESNLKNVNYSLNNGTYLSLVHPFNIPTENWVDGTYNIRVQVTDLAGNFAVKTYIFYIDSTQPNITLNSPVNNSVIRPGTTIDFDIEEPYIKNVYYSINAKQEQTIHFPYNISTRGWSDGEYNVKLFASDLVNNQNSKEFKFIIDSTMPEIGLNSPFNNSLINSGVIIDLEVKDINLDKVQYSINSGPKNPLFFPFDIETVDWVDDVYLITIIAEDKARFSVSKSFTFIYDGTIPVIDLVSPDNNSKVNIGTIIDLKVQDAHILSVEYSINRNEFEPIEAPFNISTKGWSIGNYLLQINAMDKAGNYNSKKFIISLTEDLSLVTPKIISTSPINGSIDVPLSSILIIEFNKKMNNLKVESSISILPKSTNLKYDWRNNSYLTIVFKSGFLESTKYLIIINRSAEDTSGKNLNEDYIFTFTTIGDHDYDDRPDSVDDDDDNDNIPDIWETKYGLNPLLTSDADFDLDNDSLTNLEEFIIGTLPNVEDSDGDTLNDGDEIKKYCSNPLTSDSDGDGFWDNREVLAGSDPNDPKVTPETIDAQDEIIDSNIFANNVFRILIIISIVCIVILIIISYILITNRKRSKEDKNRLDHVSEEPTEQPLKSIQVPVSRSSPITPVTENEDQGGVDEHFEITEADESFEVDDDSEELIDDSDFEFTIEIDDEENMVLESENAQVSGEEVKNLITQGSKAYSEGKYSDAIIAWQQVLEFEPGKHPEIEMAMKDALDKLKKN